MRVAAIADIHGNIRALEAVLDEVRRSDCESIVVCGDVLPGPEPVKCMNLLLGSETPVEFVHGNGESAILDIIDGRPANIPSYFEEMVRWVAEQLEPSHIAALRTFQPRISKQIEGLGEVLFCHATPRNDTEVFSKLTPADRVAPIFDGVTANLLVCGHTHMQFDREVGTRRIVNTGSIGHPHGVPGAYWLKLGPDVEFNRTDYDLEGTAQEVRSTRYPLAESWAQTILQPRSEAEILEILRPMEI